MADNTRRRPRVVGGARRLIAVVVVLAGGALMFVGSDRSPAVVGGSNLVRLPAHGASPRFLADGTPVWVIRHGDGSVSVLDAVGEHLDGVGVLAAWCERNATFEVVYGAIFDEYGNDHGGPTDVRKLVRYSFVRAGRDTVRVTGTLASAPRDRPWNGNTGNNCEYAYGFYEHTIWPRAAAIPWASPDEPGTGVFRRFHGSVIRAGNGAALCVPSKAHCDWRLDAEGVHFVPGRGGFGPTLLIGRLEPHDRVRDLIQMVE